MVISYISSLYGHNYSLQPYNLSVLIVSGLAGIDATSFEGVRKKVNVPHNDIMKSTNFIFWTF